jgi:hypothetical protein
MAYYPEPSANVRVAARTWGVSLAGLAGNNLFLEFGPDVRDKLSIETKLKIRLGGTHGHPAPLLHFPVFLPVLTRKLGAVYRIPFLSFHT